MEFKKDNFKKELFDLFGLKNPNIIGSFSKNDLTTSCDIDINEKIDVWDKNKIFEYIKKIIKNQDKFIFVTSRFNIKYDKIKKIYEKLGYLDGLLEITKLNLDDIQKEIDNLPEILNKKIQKVFDNFVKNPNLENYIRLKEKIVKYDFPSWNLIDLEKGELQYYDEKFFIRDFNFNKFYIEIFYKEITISYLFEFGNIPDETKYFVCSFRSVINFNQIKFFKLLKRIKISFIVSINLGNVRGRNVKIARELVKKIDIFSKEHSVENTINCKIYDLYKICDSRINFKNKYNETKEEIMLNDGKIFLEIYKDFEFWNDKTRENFLKILDSFNSKNIDFDINEEIIDIYRNEKKITKEKYLKNLKKINFLSRILYEEIAEEFPDYFKKYFRIY